MSYSFQVKAASKAEAKDLVKVELAKVVEAQPIHALDVNQAQAAAHCFINLLSDDQPDMDVHVSVNGSLSWRGDAATPSISGANVGVSAYYVQRKQS